MSGNFCSSPIYCLQVTGEHYLASGDDDGSLKVHYNYNYLFCWKLFVSSFVYLSHLHTPILLERLIARFSSFDLFSFSTRGYNSYLFPRTAMGFKDKICSDGYEGKWGLYQWHGCWWSTEIPTGNKVHIYMNW